MGDVRRSAFVLSFALVVGLFVPPAAGAEARPESAYEWVPGRALVGAYRSGRSAAAAAVEANGGQVVSYYEPGNFFIVRTPSNVPDWVGRLGRDPSVRFAEPDYVVSLDATPTDPRWGDLWGLQKIGMEAAWDVSTGSPTVVVGVIDTGVDYNHEDLATQMWLNDDPINGIDDDGNGYKDDRYGLDCVNNDGDPMDDHNHGTHVSGTIGAAANNGTGVAGVNWSIDIMALKFLDSRGSGTISDAVECLDYARVNGAHLTSNSWGGGGYSQAMRDAIARARDANMLFVAAAGNSSVNADAQPHYPSTYDLDNVVAVAATDSSDALASFSNYGVTTVDLGAPGVGIWSTTRNNGYASFSGTSMATPHVAGAAALLMARYPVLRADWQALLDRLYGSVDKVPALTGKVATDGRLNVARAIETETTAPGPLGLAATGSGRQFVDLGWTAPADDPGTQTPVSSYELRYAPTGTGAWMSAPAPAPASPGTTQTLRLRGLRPGTTYDFGLVAKDNAGNASSGTVAASTTAGVVVFDDDLELGTSQWTAPSPWARTGELAHSGGWSWSDSPNANYTNYRDASVTTTSFSLAGVASPNLSFWHRYSLEPGYDYGYVYISTNGGSTWTELLRYDGHRAEYEPVIYSLASYAGASDVKLRFRLTSDAFLTYEGWFLDDVLVTAAPLDPDPPAAPTGLTVGDPMTGGALSLDWNDSGEADLAGYNAYRTTDPPEPAGRTWTKVNGSLLTTSAHTDTGLANGLTYYYVVRAVDASSNESGLSEEGSGVPSDATPPALPTGLSATPGYGQVWLDWDTSGETGVTYNVYRDVAPPGSALNGSPVLASEYLDATAVNSTMYDYWVTAVDGSGNESLPTGPVSATPGTVVTRTFAPTSVTVSKGTGSSAVDDLGSDDGITFDVASKRQGRRYLVDWYASTTIDVTGVDELEIDLRRFYTGAVTETLYVYNFSAGSWQQVSSGSGPTIETPFTFASTIPGAYISTSNEIRFRIRAAGDASFTCGADRLLFKVKY